MKFVSGVGFSNGCALFALKNPPPLVPHALMISCDATGPCAMTCVSADERSRGDAMSYGLRFCTTPCETSASAPTRQNGSSTQSERADEVDPEIAEGVALALRDAANERNRERDADGGRREIVVRQAGHLREIAHRRLAAVRLPVRIGHERRRRVERQRRAPPPRVSADSTAAALAAAGERRVAASRRR